MNKNCKKFTRLLIINFYMKIVLNFILFSLLFLFNSTIYAIDNLSFEWTIMNQQGEGIKDKVIKLTIGGKIKYIVTNDLGKFEASILRETEKDEVLLELDGNEIQIKKRPETTVVIRYDDSLLKVLSTNLTDVSFNLKKQQEADTYIWILIHGFFIFNFALFSMGWYLFFKFILSDSKKTDYNPYNLENN